MIQRWLKDDPLRGAVNGEIKEMLMIDCTSLAHSADGTSAIKTPAHHTENLSDRALQRAEGTCRIVLAGAATGTRIMDVYQKSPIRVLFPTTGDGRTREAVIVNTSGGVAGGDHLQLSVTASDSASIAITTQAAEKIYRAIDQSAHITTRLEVSGAAKLAWLPQETIVFNRARVSRQTEVEISPGSEILALETLVFGRTAHGEKLSAGTIIDSWQVKENGQLRWADTFRLTDDAFPHLSRKALLWESTAIATLLYFGPKLEELLQLFRAQPDSFDCQCGATLVGGLVVVRLAARCAFELKAVLRNLLQNLGNELAPGPFRLPKMWSC